MMNRPEPISGPPSRGRRRHNRTLLGVSPAQASLPERGETVEAGAHPLGLPTPAAPPRPRSSQAPGEPSIESRAWDPEGETLEARLERVGSLTMVEADELLSQLVDFSLHQPDDGLVHCPAVQRIRLLEGTSGPELQVIGVDGAAPGDGDYESMVFQLGVVLYTALTGADPFPARSVSHACFLRANGRWRAPTSVNHLLAPSVDDFFVRTFSPDHARRFASAFEMRAAFRDLVEHALPPPRVEDEIAFDVPVEIEEDAPARESEPDSSYRLSDAVAAGFTVKPRRTGRIVVGLAALAALCVAATTFIAREVKEPPKKEQAEQLVKTIHEEAKELGAAVQQKAR